MKPRFLLAMAGFAVASTVSAQTKWDLPAAYPAGNYHTQNIQQFADEPAFCRSGHGLSAFLQQTGNSVSEFFAFGAVCCVFSAVD